MLNYLLYCSEAAPKLETQNVINILISARRFNEAHELTGILCFTGDHFVQLLEGELGALTAALQRIRSDARHTNIDVRRLRPCQSCRFGRWHMAFASAERLAQLASNATGSNIGLNRHPALMGNEDLYTFLVALSPMVEPPEYR